MDHKAIKKLADTCRKAGIKHFKSPEFEFTLTDAPPTPTTRKKRSQEAPKANSLDESFHSDSLSEDALLFWSSGDVAGDNSNNEI